MNKKKIDKNNQDDDYLEDDNDFLNNENPENNINNDNDQDYNEENTSESKLSSLISKIKGLLVDKKKVIFLVIILLVFIIGMYFIFFNKNDSNTNKNIENKKEDKNIKTEELNPYKINDNLLKDLPKIESKRSPEKQKEEIIKPNDNLLSLKLDNELKIPERKIEEPKKLPEPIKEEPKKLLPPQVSQVPIQIETKQSLPLPIAINNNGSNNQNNFNPQQPLPSVGIDESVQRKIDANVIVFAGSTQKDDNKKNEILDKINNKKKTKKTSFASISESYVGYKDRMILAGKIIDLVLESAINTENEGIVRAIIASDVYSESGFNVLIPAGSRVFGKYAPVLQYGNLRVNIMFNRIIRPDGVDIMLGDMKAISKLGSTGVSADKVDNRVGSSFGNSILIGALSLATLFATKEIEGLTDSATNNNNGGGGGGTTIVINTGNNGSNNSNGNENDYGSTTRDIIDGAISPLKQHLEKLQSNKNPNLSINQGRKISIMTDKDIVFNDENAFVFYPEETQELGIR